jgi:hypothetical protein
MDARALRSTFTSELADRLAGAGAAELAARTGLHASIVQEMTAGTSQGLLSWEVVSACVTAAELDQETIVQLRELWVQAESAEWAERGPRLLREIERQTIQARRQRAHGDKDLTRGLFDEYRPDAPWRKASGSGHPHGQWRFEPWSRTQLLTKQRMPDPDRAMSLSEFYELLKQLRQWAGQPTLAEIEQRSWGALRRTTAGDVLGVSRALHRHVRDNDNVCYMATVFGLPQTEVARWVNAYTRLREFAPEPTSHGAEQKAIAGRSPGATELPEDTLSGKELRAEPSPEAPLATTAAPSARIMARLRRWRITALCLAATATALTSALTLMVAADDPRAAQNLQFPEKLRLSPEKPVRIPLRLSTGDWSLTLRFRLESTAVASACVHDAQLSYVVEKANGVDIASGKPAKGKPDSSARAIRLDLMSALDSPQVVVSVSVPSQGIGCGFTIDLSGSTIQPR